MTKSHEISKEYLQNAVQISSKIGETRGITQASNITYIFFKNGEKFGPIPYFRQFVVFESNASNFKSPKDLHDNVFVNLYISLYSNLISDEDHFIGLSLEQARTYERTYREMKQINSVYQAIYMVKLPGTQSPVALLKANFETVPSDSNIALLKQYFQEIELITHHSF